MDNRIIEVIKKSFNENVNSHAFLMETNNYDNCLNDVLQLIFDINNKINNKDINNIPDIKVIFPDGNEIKRQQICTIIDEFKTYPVELKHRYYIIVNSELMNLSSSNTILKFLEEPDNSIIGFFITNNKNAMINTVLSRCQQFKLFYDNTINYGDDEILLFIKNMSDNEIYKKINYLNSFIKKDRNENIIFLKKLKNYLLDKNNNYYSNIKSLVNKITLLDNVVERLLKNANQELIILDIARNWK